MNSSSPNALPELRLERLTEENFEAFAGLINCEDGEWDQRKANEPDKSKACMRERVPEAALLVTLKDYGKNQGWSAIEGYPFNRETIARLGEAVTWPGFPEDFARAGFSRVGEHWLSSPEHARSIYRLELA